MTTRGNFRGWIRGCIKKNVPCVQRHFDSSSLVLYCLWGLCILCFILFCVFMAKRMSVYVPIHHIDGAFQTASGLFRLQNGEMPGRDFFPYLGVLPICICYPLFYLAGGNFTASLFAAHFAVLFCCMLSFSIIHFFISKKRSILYSICCGSALTTLFYLININFPSIETTISFSSFLFPGNSLRPIRQFAPYLCVLPLYYLYKNNRNRNNSFLYFGGKEEEKNEKKEKTPD